LLKPTQPTAPVTPIVCLAGLLLVAPCALAQIMVGDITIDAGDFAPCQAPEARIAKCLGCHGKHLAGDIDFGPEVHFGTPALWGMREDYLAESLRAYRSGLRSHKEMSVIASMLDEETIEFMAQTFVAYPLPPMRPADELQQLADSDEQFRRGQAIAREGVQEKGVPSCMSCHGSQGEGIPVLGPRLAGQNSIYIQQQLRFFADGTRRTARAVSMRPVVAGLSDDDMRAVAYYYEQLVHLDQAR
jgi:cytochrome c553